ncbi:unnamed protein product [Ixodes persulcatus]
MNKDLTPFALHRPFFMSTGVFSAPPSQVPLSLKQYSVLMLLLLQYYRINCYTWMPLAQLFSCTYSIANDSLHQQLHVPSIAILVVCSSVLSRWLTMPADLWNPLNIARNLMDHLSVSDCSGVQVL